MKVFFAQETSQPQKREDREKKVDFAFCV